MATNELPLPVDDSTEESAASSSPTHFGESIEEDSEEGETDEPSTAAAATLPAASSVDDFKYTWRIDLAKSESYWPGWFQDLSNKFLSTYVPKLLLLASIDGLDRTLTVGQMQGKFQLRVLSRCGHAVHEDRPHEVAEVIATYMQRNKMATACAETTAGQLPLDLVVRST